MCKNLNAPNFDLIGFDYQTMGVFQSDEVQKKKWVCIGNAKNGADPEDICNVWNLKLFLNTSSSKIEHNQFSIEARNHNSICLLPKGNQSRATFKAVIIIKHFRILEIEFHHSILICAYSNANDPVSTSRNCQRRLGLAINPNCRKLIR